MNRTSYLPFKFAILFLFLFIVKNNFAQYKISQIIEDNKIQIPVPYKYDGFLMNEFTFDLINKDIHNEFVAFKKQKYKLLFCSSDFEETITISIYDKEAPTIKVAEKIIDANNKTWTFEPQKAATYTIVYEVSPSNTDVEHKACIVMLIGFLMK